jgi:hypothetical protein
MKKIALIFFCLLLMPVSVFAASAEDTRGIEEDKRKSLAPTEIQQYPATAAEEPGSDKENYAYLLELYNKKLSSVADACRAISILLGKDEQFVQKIDQQGPLTKGQAAYMLCQALEIKGGLWLRLLGLNQRYALRELVYEGIMFSGSVQDFMSGRELISTLNRAADYASRFHDK